MFVSMYIECPNCKGCENHEYWEGVSNLGCSYCLTLFRVNMWCVKVHEKNKTQIDFTVEVFPLVRSNQVQLSEVAA